MHLQVQWATPTHVMELKVSLLFKAAGKAKAELRRRGCDEISEMHHFRKYGDFWLPHDSIQRFSDGSPRMSKCCTSGEQECVAKLLRTFSIQTNSCIKTLPASLDAHKLKADYTMEGELRKTGKKNSALSPGENNFHQDKQAKWTKSQLQSSTNPRGTCGFKKPQLSASSLTSWEVWITTVFQL